MASDPDEENNGRACPQCGSTKLAEKHAEGEVICTKCGAVVEEESFDRGPEWRAFDQEERESRSRGGPPITNTLHDKGLSTEISSKNRDAKGNSLSPEKRSQMHRVRKWNRRSKTSAGRSRYLREALSEIKGCISRLGLPESVRERASDLYRKASEEDLIKGKPKEDMIAASLYAACKWLGHPRTLEELCDALPRAEVSRSRKSHLGLLQNVDVEPEVVSPGAYVLEYCRKLKVSDEVRKKALDIAGKVSELGLMSENSPRVASAGIVYVASLAVGDKLPQGIIQATTDVSRAAFSDAKDELGEIFHEGDGESE